MWWKRVIVHRKQFTQLYEIHPSSFRMKHVAHGLVWWPGLDCNIEELEVCCAHCQESCLAYPAALTHPGQWPNKPWVRQHAEFVDPVKNKMLIIVADA